MAALIRIIRHTDRPAFSLALGAVLGFLWYELGLLWPLSIFLLLFFFIALYAFLRRTQIQLDGLFLFFLWALLFGWYTSACDYKANHLVSSQTYSGVSILLKSPLKGRGEAVSVWRAEVSDLEVYLYVPSSVLSSRTQGYGREGRGDVDLVPLSALGQKGWARTLRSQGFEAVGVVQSLGLSGVRRFSFRGWLSEVREGLLGRFSQDVSGVLSGEEYSVLVALSTGDRTHLGRWTRDRFARAGVAHILAVSGYHLGVVYALVSFLLGRVLWSYRYRRVRLLLLLFALLFYALFTGGAPSTLRALVMSSVFILSSLFSRRGDLIQSLSLAVVVLMCLNPFVVYNVGFLLSVSAVWGIALFFPLLRGLFTPRHMLLSHLSDLLFLSLSAQAGVLPLLLYFFGEFSVAFLWSSIPVTLLSFVVIPLSVLSLFFSSLGFSALVGWLAVPLSWLSKGMLLIVSLFSSFPSFSVKMVWWGIPLYYLCLYGGYLWLSSRLSRSIRL